MCKWLVPALLLAALFGCQRPSPQSGIANPGNSIESKPGLVPTPALATAAATAALNNDAGETGPLPAPSISATLTAVTIPTVWSETPVGEAALARACGQLLPILPQPVSATRAVEWDPAAREKLEAMVPPSAQPALARMLAVPENVGLAAYRVGREAEGVFLNANVPMPLASVVKVIHLIAYTEAVAAGELNPLEIVQVEELDQFYLPGLDLGAHLRAIEELEQKGRLLAGGSALYLEDVPWMMIRHSSNAAMDYLHMRLGQNVIEETVVGMGLSSHTAPCPFLGQFLAMSNHTQRSGASIDIVQAYINDPEGYGREATRLTIAYSSDPTFRQEEIARGSRPSLPVQRFFGENLNPQGSAAQYAALMTKIAQNGLGNGESSYLSRLYLEWPMQFPANQELFSNLGYKNGSLPGILTTVYYAYPVGETTAVVAALFFRDLPNRTYQQWRRNLLPHDELARWLLYDPEAIPAMRAVFNTA